ncbi:MAG: ABC transporter ATP-binding protein [Acidobacteriota bacterium]
MNSLTADNLGKCFYIAQGRGRDASRGNIAGRVWARAWGRKGERLPSRQVKEFWALRNVSFSVQPGTVLGIIGPNGAGKSTLLRVIARVILPSEGRVVGIGRVVSLLELGAGFNPEVSARENIFMNAAMYGVPRSDVVRHFDEIVGFAEIGDFVDNPLKFYSSGMYLRLAFSVAINMRPAILLADEILAVGDMAFQERCLKRVEAMAKNGLTVLFVSHDMDAIIRVCDRALWLSAGQTKGIGDPEEVVTAYQNAAWATADVARSERGRHVNRYAEILNVRLVTTAGKEVGAAPASEDVFIRIRFAAKTGLSQVRCGFDLYRRTVLLFRSADHDPKEIGQVGIYEAWGRIPAHFLSEIVYTLNAFVVFSREGKEMSLVVHNALSFMSYATEEPSTFGQRLLKDALLAPRLEWRLAPLANAD